MWLESRGREGLWGVASGLVWGHEEMQGKGTSRGGGTSPRSDGRGCQGTRDRLATVGSLGVSVVSKGSHQNAQGRGAV